MSLVALRRAALKIELIYAVARVRLLGGVQLAAEYHRRVGRDIAQLERFARCGTGKVQALVAPVLIHDVPVEHVRVIARPLKQQGFSAAVRLHVPELRLAVAEIQFAVVYLHPVTALVNENLTVAPIRRNAFYLAATAGIDVIQSPVQRQQELRHAVIRENHGLTVGRVPRKHGAVFAVKIEGIQRGLVDERAVFIHKRRHRRALGVRKRRDVVRLLDDLRGLRFVRSIGTGAPAEAEGQQRREQQR